MLVTGCGTADRPFDRIDLIPSYWDVTSVNGAEVAGDAPSVFSIERSSSARVQVACGEIDFRYTVDLKGSALSFAELRVDAACQSPPDQQDVAIRAAAASVRGWRVTSADTIEMLDAGGRAILALRMTTCNCPHSPPGSVAPTSS